MPISRAKVSEKPRSKPAHRLTSSNKSAKAVHPPKVRPNPPETSGHKRRKSYKPSRLLCSLRSRV